MDNNAVIPDSLGAQLIALARLHRTQLGELLAPHGLHPGQDVLLMLLWETPGLRPAELAERLDVEPPTVTRMLKRLERGGLVSRQRNADDARSWHIHPTPRSRMLEATVRRAWMRLDDHLREGLGAAESARLLHLMATAAATLRERLPPEE